MAEAAVVVVVSDLFAFLQFIRIYSRTIEVLKQILVLLSGSEANAPDVLRTFTFPIVVQISGQFAIILDRPFRQSPLW